MIFLLFAKDAIFQLGNNNNYNKTDADEPVPAKLLEELLKI